MLNLRRRHGESILVKFGDKVVRIMVLQLKTSNCLLGFEAPDDVKILRSEVKDFDDDEQYRTA